MKVLIELIVPDDAEFVSPDESIRKAIRMSFVDVPEAEPRTLKLEAEKEYVPTEVLSNFEKIEFPDGTQFSTDILTGMTCPKFKVVKSVYGQWMIVAVMPPGWKPHKPSVGRIN